MDFYEQLGISRAATTAEVNQAYRKLALELHPDRNIGNEKTAADKFKKVAEAFEIIGDPNKRARYNLKFPEKKPPVKPQREKQKPPMKDGSIDWGKDPNFKIAPKSGRAPTHDIWGNPMTPEQRRQWELYANSGVEFVILPLNQKPSTAEKMRMEAERKRRQAELEKAQRRAYPSFFDAYEDQYESQKGQPDIR